MTLMNILATKGHLTRRLDERAYVYSPTRPRHQVVARLVSDFVDRVFSGSAQPLLRRSARDLLIDDGAVYAPRQNGRRWARSLLRALWT
jgi:predicted transcriptional regulator